MKPALHLPALDGVRGIAVLLVVLHHWDLPRNFPIDRGLLGVRLFFVLSGLLITSILLTGREALRDGATTLAHFAKSFYARRFLRIFPLYYLTLALLWLCDVAGVRDEIAWHLLYATSFQVAHANSWIGLPSHFWSLSVEEQFYLAWPWLVLLVPARRLRLVLVAMVLAGVAWRAFGPLAGLGRFAVLYVLPSCLDALGVGATLAVLAHENPGALVRARIAMAASGAVVLAAATAITRAPGATAFTQAVSGTKGLAYALLLGALVSASTVRGSWLARAMAVPPLVYVGRVSYAVYVVHPLVPYALRALGLEPHGRVLQVTLWGVVTVALAALSWQVLEGPLNAQKKRFPYVTTR